jgi:phage I-like protein
MDQIQIIAALKGKITDEERTRLKLQLAILTENASEASKLAGEVAKAQGLTKDLVAYYSDMPKAADPFDAWIKSLMDAEAIAKRIADLSKLKPSTGGGSVGSSLAASTAPTDNLYQNIINEGIARGETQATINSSLRYTAMGQQAMGQTPVVNVQVMLDGEEMTGAITKTQTNNYLSGKILTLERLQSTFG